MNKALRATFLAASILVPSALAEAAERTVYVTVVDGNGTAVTDLTAADLVVKEGGKEREIVKAGRASAKMRLTIAVEERLMADASVRQAMFAFMKRVIDSAEVRLVTIGLRNHTAADYTTALDALVTAINNLTLNPRPESQVAEGVLEVASEFTTAKGDRPVLVVTGLFRRSGRRRPAQRPRKNPAERHDDERGDLDGRRGGCRRCGGDERSERPGTDPRRRAEAVGRPAHRSAEHRRVSEGAPADRRRPAGPVRDYLYASRRRQAGQALQHQLQAPWRDAARAFGDS